MSTPSDSNLDDDETYAYVNPCIQKLLDEVIESEFEDGHGWLHSEHSDKFKRRCEEAEKLVGILDAPLRLDAKGETLGELALREPLEYKTRKGEKCTVYLVGTDHDTAESAKEIRMVAEKIKPDYICAEHPKDWKQELTDTMTKIWADFNGDVEAMAKAYREGDDKEFCSNMRKVGHAFRDDKHSDQLNEWGTFHSVDVGMCALMAHQFETLLKWIDIPEYAHDKKFGPVWDHVAMHVCLKKIFNVDCLADELAIEAVYQLAAGTHLQPVHIMRVDQAIEATIAPGMHALGTHTRDLYMQWRVQQICENNPGKTILVVMGAFHALNIRDKWGYRIPQSLAQCVESQTTTRKQMDKKFKQYGGRMSGQAKEAKYEKFGTW